MLERITCPSCGIKPVAINYHKNGRTYYRARCDQCSRHNRKPLPAGWIRSGYKKKDTCERCRFKFKVAEQASVYHVDHNDANNDWVNLKTVCANCVIELAQPNAKWTQPRKLTPDF